MLKQRITSGLLLGAALLATVFFLPPLGVLVVVLVICALSLLEFYALLDASQIPHFKVVGVLCGLALIAATWFSLSGHDRVGLGFDTEALVLFASTGIIFIREIIYKDDEHPWQTMAGTLLGIMYVAFLMNFFTKLLTAWGDLDGRFLMLYLAVIVKFTDMGAFFIGCAIGRHKLIPRISPAKSWEGCIGGALTGVVASLVYSQSISHGRVGPFVVSVTDAVILGVLLASAGIFGDLIESLLKRAAGVKDSGRIIQGMGGVLDVMDSLLFAAPVLYVYARLFLEHVS